MNRVLIVPGALLIALILAVGDVQAQCCYPAPRVVYSGPAPVVTYYSTPIVTCPAPVVVPAAPVVARRPVVPTTVYRPVYPLSYAPVVTVRPVLVDTDLYVPGQPIRNFFRAITP